MSHAFSYEQPSLVTLLVLSSFLYLLNAVRVVADYTLYAGLIAEIAFGIVFGSPLANLLPIDWETTFSALGYLGLILVVFEGGLSTNLPVLLSNLPLSIICALTGIALPIALSFALLNVGFGFRPLEAFAAGAALSSTSLGTTLAALNSVTKSNNHTPKTPALTPNEDSSVTPPSLQQSRIGTVLISAAIIDDVVGLVIASLIPALASIESDSTHTTRGNLAWTIVRPLLSSFLVAVVGCLLARFVLRPLFWYHGLGERWCAPARPGKPWAISFLSTSENGWGSESHADSVKLFLMVAVVSALAAITNYTGTSVLYGAYVAGLILTYISKPLAADSTSMETLDSDVSERYALRETELSFEHSFARSVGPLQSYLLLPLFFASIGFAIPFLSLWHPRVLWRGVVYSILMCLAKLAVGLPILFYTGFSAFSRIMPKTLHTFWVAICAALQRSVNAIFVRVHPNAPPATTSHENGEKQSESSGPSVPIDRLDRSQWREVLSSIPAAVFMGVAMVSRGEIGLLIAQLARTGSDQSSSDPTSGLLGDEAFTICIWAILLCTLVGPVSVGVVVRRWGPKITAGVWT